jgi:carboxylesterase
MTDDRDLIYIVHGSNAHTWWRRLANGGYAWWRRWSLFACEIRRAFGYGCEIREFRWSGLNSHDARMRAGTDLARAIEAVDKGRRIHIVGHSHGGNVALAAANHLGPGRVETIVLLANPHMALVEKHGVPPQWLYWGRATENAAHIWNLYSPQDKVQVSLAGLFHGLSPSIKQTLIVRRNYGGIDFKPLQNGEIHWSNALAAHRAMHSAAVGVVVGRLLRGETFPEAMKAAGLSIEGRNDTPDRGGFPGFDKTQALICELGNAAPFDFGDAASDVGILLVHGFTASPAEMRPMGEYLAARKGWRCKGILLPGHGTRIEDMRKTTGADWVDSVEKTLKELSRECRHVFLAGLSLGAVLSCHVALRAIKDEKLRGMILMAPAFGVSTKKAIGVRLLSPFVKLRAKGTRASDYFLDHGLYSYVHNPLNRVMELLRLGSESVRRLPELKKLPTVLFVGDLESTVSLDKQLMAAKENPWIRLVRLPKSRHILPLEPDRARMFEETEKFVEECLRGHT